MLIDTHCHLNDLGEKELASVLTNAGKAGVGALIGCSTSFESNEKNLAIAQAHPAIVKGNTPQPAIKVGIGLYPLDILELSDEELDRAFKYFTAHAHDNEVIAIGEVGLDHKYCTDEEGQAKMLAVFQRFIQLSNECEKPLNVHTRFAQRQVLEALHAGKARKVQLHSFTDSTKLMNQAVKYGYYISVGINLLHNEEVQKRIKEFPLSKLLAETDAPITFAGQTGQCDKVRLVVEKIAQLKGMSVADVERHLTTNAIALYGDALATTLET